MPHEEKPLRLETRCVTAREQVPHENRSLVAPIWQTAVWSLDSPEQCDAVYGAEVPGFIYTREANPNHASLEAAVADLEGAEECVAFGSGMAALAAAVTSVTSAGQRILAARQLYGASGRFLTEELARFGVETGWVDIHDLDALRRRLAEGASALLVETLSNPLVELADLPSLAALCREAGAALVVDSTFATPWCCRPLAFGADLVVHSVTKFLAGHSDLTLGAVGGSRARMADVRRESRLWGGCANPFEAWLAVRGLTTYPLRMERSCANAAELAARLESHRAVRQVWHPSRPGYPQAGLASRLLTAPGPMLAFRVRSGRAARSLLRRLRLVRFAPSLGDVATTISYPVLTSHRGQSAEQLQEVGIDDAVLRLSVGIDHVDDVWEDLDRALNAR